MIKENKFIQYGFPRNKSDIKGITLHETGNYTMSAQNLCDWLDNDCKTSQGTHYIVDKDEVVQVMPDDWSVYHTGKGNDWGNRYTIAIEIVSYFSNELYKIAEDKAIELVKTLQKKYHIPNNMIFFHQSFNSVLYCPTRILDEYKTVTNFVYQRIESEE